MAVEANDVAGIFASQLPAAFDQRLQNIAVADPGALEAIGHRAKARVARMFTWDAKAGQVLEVYRWALGDGPRPDFGMPFRDPPT